MKNFSEMLTLVKTKPRKTVIISAAQTESALDAAVLAYKEGIADSILVGNASEIKTMLSQTAPDLADKFEIIDTGTDLQKAAWTSVELANAGKGQVILKGKTDTAGLLKAALDKEKGLRVSDVISDVLVFEHPDGIKMLSDGGINILPEFNEKVAIIRNAVSVAHSFGIAVPKVAVLSAVEAVNPKMPSTVDAALLSLMNQRGQITGCIVEGPLAFDNAVDITAAKIKNITSPVGGNADIFIVPNIEAGNIFGKMLVYYCHYRISHVAVGTKVPILIPSRADEGETKLLCIATALLCL
ncbi:MAG TPA: bifunctional enoyl-CoA hydratase/phosphate acetyltransferase [Candidatus Cloacimonadota bacterium]|nr:bifunctional enoyl-CoA hydratase/phosphate acetyltransferase [Candidatus Cloacimonadota bacterium]